MTYRNVSPRTRTAYAGALLIISLTALAVLCATQPTPMADTLVYRAEGAAVANGTDLYGFTVTEWKLPATYPPFAAILFVPTTWLPFAALKVTFLVGNAVLLALLVRLSCRLAGLPAWTPAILAATAVALWLEPVFQTLLFGQINLVLACVVLWDLTRPPTAPARGFALGVATGVKLTPGIFIVYLLLTGRIREGVTALASFAGTVALGALVLPGATVEFFTRRVFETGRVGKAWIVDNQSLQGLVARVLHTETPGPLWAATAAVTACAGLWLARRAGYGAHGLLITAFTALLISPISWSHHWVWCVPLVAVLIADGRPRLALAATVLFTARTMWLVPHTGDLDLHLPWWQQPLASPYPLLGLTLLALAARSRGFAPVDRPPAAPSPSPSGRPGGRAAPEPPGSRGLRPPHPRAAASGEAAVRAVPAGTRPAAAAQPEESGHGDDR